jgi:hypothetical protein
MKWGVGGRAVLGRVLYTTAKSQLHDFLDINVQGLQVLPYDALRHFPVQLFVRVSHIAFLREREGVETHTLPPWKERSALSAALEKLPVDGTTFTF